MIRNICYQDYFFDLDHDQNNIFDHDQKKVLINFFFDNDQKYFLSRFFLLILIMIKKIFLIKFFFDHDQKYYFNQKNYLDQNLF